MIQPTAEYPTEDHPPETPNPIDHVGLVITDNRDGTISTVEGNTDDAVQIKTRSTNKVVGYGYPDYAK